MLVLKTQIIQLESHDDFISTRDKIAWNKSARLILVWPVGEKLLGRKIDLLLIKRQAQRQGSQLALVSRGSEVYAWALELAIPIFSSIEEAQQKPWRRARQKNRTLEPSKGKQFFLDQGISRTIPQNKNFGRRLFFLLGILAVVVLALFFLPGARIKISLTQKEQTLDLSLQANPAIMIPDLAGDIPAYNFMLEVEGNKEIPSGGSIFSPDAFAAGQVVFTNVTDQMAEIPAGTVVLTLGDPPVRFQTVDPLIVAPGVNHQASIQVISLLPGLSGNVDAGAIQAVEGNSGLKVTVTNPDHLSGGSEIESSTPTQADYEELKSALLEEILQKALTEFQGMVGTAEKLIPASIKVDKILEEDLQPEIGQPSDVLSLRLKVRLTCWYVKNTDVETAARLAMDATIPAGFESLPGTFSFESAREPFWQDEKATWEIHGSRRLRPVIQTDGILTQLAGLTIHEAGKLLNAALPLSSEAEIQIFPSWWDRLPFITPSIQLEVE